MKKYIKIFIIFSFLVLVFIQSNKKFVIDEIDFPIVSKATSESGVPIYYRGEEKINHIGIYHPTLYINSLAFFIKIFGFSEMSVRIFGALCAIGSGLIIVKIYDILSRGKKGENSFELFFLAIFLWHPYTIANATIPDIDTTIMPLNILFFIYSTFYFLNGNLGNVKNIKKSIVILSIIFSLNLWTKLTTPLILPFFLLAWLLIKKNSFIDSICYAFKVSFLGGALFLFSYWLYCFILDLPFEYTFLFLVHSFTKGTNGQFGIIEKIITNLSFFRQFIYWLIIPFFVSFFVSIFFIYKKNISNIRDALLLIISLDIFVIIFYISLMPPFAGFFKYPFAIFALTVFPVAFYFSEILGSYFFRKYSILYSFLLISIIITQVYLLGDIEFKNNYIFSHFIFLGVFIIFLISILSRLKNTLIFRHFICLFFIFILGFQIGISFVQATSEYPTKYHYGQLGLDDTVNYLKIHTNKDEPIWSMKDVGYYVNNKYFENYLYFSDKSLEDDLKNKLESGNVRYYVVTTGIGQDRVDVYLNIRDILDKYAKIEARFGNFIIYKKQ